MYDSTIRNVNIEREELRMLIYSFKCNYVMN